MPDPSEPDATSARNYTAAATGDLKVPHLEAAKAGIDAMNQSLEGLRQALGKFATNPFMASGADRILKNIADQASKTTQAVNSTAAALGGVGGGGGGGGGGGSVPAGPGGSWASSANSQASSAVSQINRQGGLKGDQYLGTNADKATALTLAPLRFLNERITTNRNMALQGSSALGLASRQQGAETASMFSMMSRFPGDIYGSPSELLNLFSAAPSLGASYSFGNRGREGQGVRAQGFFAGVSEMQKLNPGANVADLAGTIGGYAANTRSQQQSTMLTGGAFSIIGMGGRQKSLSEWAESILRWLEGLRGGADRGKPFDYGQLMSQYFPGSNIDAWFDANAVPQNMREYWWTYALGKANKTGGTGGKAMEITPDSTNLSYQRMRSTSELTRTEFGLAGSMNGAYSNREDANRWFNSLIGQMQRTLIPSLANNKLAGFIQYLPDTIQDLLMGAAEKGVGGMFNAIGSGDVGDDVGDYGSMGGTGLSGMHPDMKRKVGSMMQANPRLSITSGLRDENLQRNLKRKGHSRVSGKSSAHTRGMAADLGPPSQYGWIVNNAQKFGLKSGNNQGEPWHVGMGDIFDDPVDAIGKIGGNPSAIAEFIASLLGTISGKLGKMAGVSPGATDVMGPAYDPTLYDRLVEATNRGLPSQGVSGESRQSRVEGLITGGSRNSTGEYNHLRTPSKDMAKFSSSDELVRGKAVAEALYAAGFRGQELVNMVSIAFRESHWNPNAWNGQGQDRSGGLLQINQKPYLDKGMTPPFSIDDLLDPYANAQIAYDMYTRKIPNKGGYSPWDYPGDPSWQYKVDFGKGQEAVHAAGLGDMESMNYAAMLPSRASAGAINFNNSFVISGGGNGAGAGGIDVRRTVTMIADQLEAEMGRRTARTN